MMTNKATEITVLAPEYARIPAELVDIVDHTVRLRVEQPISINSAVRIDLDDLLLLGEVRSCSAEEQHFTVGVEVAHALNPQKVRNIVERAFEE